ncbi:hypothetical protein, conserved [Babesia bigemina]|uniref:Uncharacterized protein n=1 Tax=Babesia bigemina TaxID=5866 RepID=A0A061D3Z5_BABBI|nr:hypothetical protein, conserved [Babesia bigemina]CDR93699.1 hypothetical protein, conserved [Babesia bigemina]|eukprot:XP_012765885.1 hypothetical protein, conserved [Babesia bigemina]
MPPVEAPDGFYGASAIDSSRMDYSSRTDGTDGVGPLHGLSARAPKGDASNSVLERYSGALDMLRNQLWCMPASGNVTFEEGFAEEESSMGHQSSRSSDPSHLIKVERDLCSQSSVFLKRLLVRADRVPASVIDSVLSDRGVVRRLRKLNDTFTFGKRLYLPHEDLPPEVMSAVNTACGLFNGSCVPAVMWPCTDRNADHNERVTITESAVFEALQIHRLLKHNRGTYVEWGRSATSGHAEAGPLPIDVTDSAAIREVSDTILDELSSTMWCIGFLALHLRSKSDDKLRRHASDLLSDPEELTSRLWKYYLAFSDHVKMRCTHLKDIDKTLNANLSGRLVVEVHRVLSLQCAIVKALLDIHMGTRSMSVSEYERYEAHFERRGFSGAFSAARTVIGADECASSPLLMHAVQELQCLGSLLLSSFYLYDAFGDGKYEVTKKDFLLDTTDLMRKQLMVSGRGPSDNKSSVILVFAYACFLKDLSREKDYRNVDASFASDVAIHVDNYSECLEWIVLTRDMLSVSGSTAVATSSCRLVLLESICRVIECFGIEKLPHLDRIIFCICRIVKGDDSVSDRSYRKAKLWILEHVSSYLMSHFPFGLNALFQLLAACLPHSAESRDDSLMDVDSDCSTMELVVKFLLKPFGTITLSPLITPLEYKADTNEFELSGDVYVGIQLLHMLGFDKQVLFDQWFAWGLGNCLYYLRSGSVGKRVSLNNLRHLSTKQNELLNAHENSWVVDAGMQNIALDSSLGAFWIQESQMPKPSGTSGSLSGCRFELENGMCVTCYTTGKQSASQPEPALHFTLLRAIWIIWRGSMLYVLNMNCDLPDHALRTFVECNALLVRLITKFPRLVSLIEDHIVSSLHMGDASSKFPFGPCSLIFHYTLLFVLCLQRRQLRIMLPEVIEALRGFLIPAYVVPVGDNATEVEFSRYWIFMESFEFCCQGLADEYEAPVFLLMDRIMQEEELPMHIYPVTRGVLLFFKELLEQCPPELWMLSGWHHGMLNMSHTSLDMESNNVTHGLGLSYLSSLKRYVDANAHKSRELYNPFQAKLLCEFFAFVMKDVSPRVAEFEFADNGERLDILCAIADIVQLICRIFRVHNYDNSKSEIGGASTETSDDSWVQGLKELINRCLLILSGSNYIMEVINALTCQVDILAYHQSRSGSLVMVNPLTFIEVSSDFFTVRKAIKSRTAVHITSTAAPDCGYASCYQSACGFRWLCQQEFVSLSGKSKRLISSSLRLLRDLYVVALPRNRNPLFATLAESLGSNYFVNCRTEVERRRRYMQSSDKVFDSNDPVAYYASRQVELLCGGLPVTSVVQSLVAHTYSGSTVAAATDILSMYLLLHEQYKLDSGALLGSFVINNSSALQQLGHMRGNYDVISQSSKDEACLCEHLVCVFLDPTTTSFETRLSIMQYILVVLSTCSGMEMLLRNGIDVEALVDFVDSVLRYHVLHGRRHNLGDVTVAQYALLIFARLVELSKGAHRGYCWRSVTLSLRVLIDLWRSFDSNLFVDPEVALNQQGVVPRSTMVKELWFEQVSPDMYVDMSDSLLERRLGLMRIMGSVYAVLDCMNVQLRCSKSSGRELLDEFLRLLSFVSTNWDFMDTLLPIIVYDSGFVDTYVRNDVTQKNMRQYYRLGLWLGEDSMLPLTRCLHYLHDMNVPPELLLMSGDAPSEINPLDAHELLHSVVSQKLARLKNHVPEKTSRHDFFADMLRPLLSDIVGPPEVNGFENHRPKVNFLDVESPRSDSVHPDYSFYSFGTSSEFGHRYMMDVEMFRHFCMALLTSADDQVNVLLSRGMASVRGCVEMVPYVDSLNELKLRLLSQLCHLVANFRYFGSDLETRMGKLLRADVYACEKDSQRTLKTPMPPFEMFAFNGAMLLQLALTRPDCLSEHPVYVGLLIEFLRLLFEKSFSLSRLESSFVSYYECCRSADASDGGFVDYIVSRDLVGSGDAASGPGDKAKRGKTAKDKPDANANGNRGEVGQDFRLFAVNVLGGLVAQVARCVVEFSERFHEVIDVNFTAPNYSRGFLKLRMAAFRSCLMYRGRIAPKGDPSMSPGAFSDVDTQNSESQDCVCSIAVGKGGGTDSVSVWLHFKLSLFFVWLYKALSVATKSAHEHEPRGVEDGVLEVYERVTKYALKSITQSCVRTIGCMQKENASLLQCFVGGGYGTPHTGEVEAAYVLIMGPYASMLALESIVCTDYNAAFLHGKGYVHLVEVMEAVTQLPYTTSACIANQDVKSGDLVNPMLVMKRDKQIMADSLRSSTGRTFQYANRNMLRAVLYKLMQRLNFMLMRGMTCKEFASRFAASQQLQLLYVYSFLCNFVQPLDDVNPKKMLATFSDNVVSGARGNCVEVIENSLTMWYPPYQGYRVGIAVRCPYHLLHCGMLRFLVEMCSTHDVGGVVDAVHMDSDFGVHSLILDVLRLMHARMSHMMIADKLTLAHLEETHMMFSVLRHLPNRHRLSAGDSALVNELLHYSSRFFSTLMRAFQHGLDKLVDMIPTRSAAELHAEPPKSSRSRITPRSAPSAESSTSERRPGPFQQRCLYLALKIAESFATFLLNLEITVGVDSELPPPLEHFVKTDDPQRIRRMCGVDNAVFQGVLHSTDVDKSKWCPGDHQPLTKPHEVTFEHMVETMGSCVDLCTWSLGVCKDLRIPGNSPFLVGVRRPDSNEVILPLSVFTNFRGEASKTSIEGFPCSIYRESSAPPLDHVDVAPAAIPVSEIQSLVECVIEKTTLYCARAVNTAFVQNQLHQHDLRLGRAHDTAQFDPSGVHSGLNRAEPYGVKRRGGPGRIHSTMRVLHNAFADVAASASCLSASTIEFCAVLSSLVERRVTQARVLSEAFGDTFLYLESA